jgi:hypothetical protein
MQKQMQVQKHTAKKCKSQIKKHAGAKAQFAFLFAFVLHFTAVFACFF